MFTTAFVRPAIQILGGVGLYVLGVTAVSAGEVPTVGLLYNTKETSSLTYSCEQDQDRSLECEFIQTAVRKKAKPEHLDSKLKQGRDEFRGGVDISTDECKTNNEMVEVLEGRKKTPKEKGWKEITEMQKEDFLLTIKALSEFCQARTEENYLKFVHLIYGKDTRTCRVSSNPYKQKFKFVQNFNSGAGSWVTLGTPEGPCGIVQLSRFESERMKDSKFVSWKYIARKAITNPKGFTSPGMLCKDLDESEYLYDWASKEHSPGCDYIEFSR